MLTIEYLRNYMDYDPATGQFSYKERQGYRSAGAVCGRTNSLGYRQISIKRQRYMEHRLAWFHVYGQWPDGQIDHINLIKTDNRIANLRVATPSQNLANTRAKGSSGYKGVTWNKSCSKWQASIKVSGKYRHLGVYVNPEEAHAAYVSAAQKYYGEFARAA